MHIYAPNIINFLTCCYLLKLEAMISDSNSIDYLLNGSYDDNIDSIMPDVIGYNNHEERFL